MEWLKKWGPVILAGLIASGAKAFEVMHDQKIENLTERVNMLEEKYSSNKEEENHYEYTEV